MKKLTFSWLAEDLKNSDEWIFRVDEKLASLIRDFVKDQFHLEKPLFEYPTLYIPSHIPLSKQLKSGISQSPPGINTALVLLLRPCRCVNGR